MIEAMAGAAVPLILAAMGALLSEQAGVLNISLEGCIGSGAFTAAMVLASGGSPLAAAAAALLSGVFFGFLLSAAHIGAGANLFIAGLGINLLIPSISDLISQVFWSHKGTIRVPDGILEGFNNAGVGIISWLMIPFTALTIVIIRRTEFGRKIRTAGSSPEFLKERGISSGWTKTWALVISSAMASLSGVFLAFRIGGFVPGMSSGRGWIALVIVWLGFRRPAGILISAYFFSLIEIISGRAQGLSSAPATLLLALPYLAALLALSLATAGRATDRTRK